VNSVKAFTTVAVGVRACKRDARQIKSCQIVSPAAVGISRWSGRAMGERESAAHHTAARSAGDKTSAQIK